MAQFQSPINYVTGDQVTAANLNNHINGAVALPGLITDQSSMTANTLATGDQFFVYDLSVTALRKVNASDILGSGLAITTSAIGSPTATDLVLTPAASQKVDVAGTLEADDINVTDDLTVTGDTTLSGPVVTSSTITANGASTFVGNVIVDNGLTSNGTANFTGVLQVNGSTAYVLYGVDEENIPKFTATNNSQLYSAFTSFSYTKPSGEIWIVEFNVEIMGNAGRIHYRLTNSADTTTYQSKNGVLVSLAGTQDVRSYFDRVYLNTSNTHSGTFVLRVFNTPAGVIINPEAADYTGQSHQGYGTISKFRIYKYKTA
jgi:hypothetical protein